MHNYLAMFFGGRSPYKPRQDSDSVFEQPEETTPVKTTEQGRVKRLTSDSAGPSCDKKPKSVDTMGISKKDLEEMTANLKNHSKSLIDDLKNEVLKPVVARVEKLELDC